MTPEHKDFLLAEFKAAWDMVNGIDNRRGTFASFYTAVFIGTLSVFVTLIRSGSISPELRIGLTLVLVILVLGGAMVIGILLSEREANKRYRRKINIIRAMFLGNSSEQYVKDYLKHKELGIILSDEKDQPKGVGRTLRLIFGVVGIQLVIIVGLLWWLWAN